MCNKTSLGVKQFLLLFFLSAYIYNVSAQSISTFENLSLPADSMWNGSDLSGGFNSGAARFMNNFTDWGGGFTSWDGFAYSNRKDTVTANIDNQYSTYAGSGYNSSSNFAIGYCYPTTKIRIVNPTHPKRVQGFYVTNNTYAALSMKNGDLFSKKFGGTSGNDPDWFKLSIWGYENGQHTDTIDFFLADYRFANNDSDYIVKDWRWVDVTSLGNIDSLEFILSSTDNGMYGMNTPGYFCIDNFTIDFLPEVVNPAPDIYITNNSLDAEAVNVYTIFEDIDTPDSLINFSICYGPNNVHSYAYQVNDSLFLMGINIPITKELWLYDDTVVICANSNGYITSDTIIIHVNTDIAGQIQEQVQININMYPNPATNYLHIDLENETGISSVSLYDISGRMLIQKENTKSPVILDLHKISAGKYLLNIATKSGNSSHKISVIK